MSARVIIPEKTEAVVTPADILTVTAHRPWPLPPGPWRLRMRWTDLLFAHWPVEPAQLEKLLPSGLALDTFEGAGWVGVVPFRMGRVQLRRFPAIPGTRLFAEANVRTYVFDRTSGQRGVYFFALDASNPLAVVIARGWYHLPYYFARMRIEEEAGDRGGWLNYRSRRLFSRQPASLNVSYRSAPRLPQTALPPAALAHFLTERYALFTAYRGRVVRADIHHLPWTLEPAEAEFEDLSIVRAHAIELPASLPVLHYSRRLDVYAWQPAPVR